MTDTQAKALWFDQHPVQKFLRTLSLPQDVDWEDFACVFLCQDEDEERSPLMLIGCYTNPCYNGDQLDISLEGKDDAAARELLPKLKSYMSVCGRTWDLIGTP